MADNNPSTPDYTMGFSEEIMESFRRYTAASCAAYLLPRLQPGFRVLDVGCGPGSISVGLAEAVAPGELHGIDMEPSQIEVAGHLAQSHGRDNVILQVADALNLPFEDDYFDAVHCHNILMHVPDTAALLTELKRVLKPGGIIGAREMIVGSSFTYPDYGVISHAWDMFADLLEADDGHPQMGRELKGRLAHAGFSDIEVSATIDVYSHPEDVAFIYWVVQNWFLSPEILEAAIKYGASTQELADQISQTYEKWREDPAAFCAIAFGEATATNP